MANFYKALEKNLRNIATAFADDRLISNGCRLDFDKHISLLKIYLRKNIQNINTHDFLLVSEFLDKLLASESQYHIQNEHRLAPVELILSLYLAKIIDLHSVRATIIEDYIEDMVFQLGIPDLSQVDTHKVRNRLGLDSVINKIVQQLPSDRNYWYENWVLHFMSSNGDDSQVIDFSSARVSRKLFEAFWYLWENDQERIGEYSKDEVAKAYGLINNNDTIAHNRIAEIISNIRSTKIDILEKEVIAKRIVWYVDKYSQKCIFRIR